MVQRLGSVLLTAGAGLVLSTALGSAAAEEPPTRTGADAQASVTGAELAPAPEPDSPQPARATATARGGSAGTAQKAFALVSGAIGLAGIIVGTTYGASAIDKNEESLSHCPGDPDRCSAEGVALREEAITAGHTSTVALVIGAVGIVTGLVLWATAPSGVGDAEPVAQPPTPTSAGMQLLPMVNLGQTAGTLQRDQGAGLVLRGQW